MLRAPGVNIVLNGLKTAGQFVSRRNAFEEIAIADAAALTATSASKAPSTGGDPLNLRDLSSNALWLQACAKVRASTSSAIRHNDTAEVERGLSHFGSLLRLSRVLLGLGAMGRTQLICLRQTEKSFCEILRQGVEAGAVAPSSSRGISSEHFLRIRIEKSESGLFQAEEEACVKFHQAVQRGFAGIASKKLNFCEADLEGLPENLRAQWASRLNKGKFSMSVGRDTMARVMPYCQNAGTRQKVFEAYFEQFDKIGVHERALELLRVRKDLARNLGYPSYAHYELMPLTTNNPTEARQLMDNCWKDACRGLAPAFKRMDELAGGAQAAGTAKMANKHGMFGHVGHSDEAFYRAHVNRQMDVLKLAEFLPASGALHGLLDVVGQTYDVRFKEIEVDNFQLGWRESVSVLEVIDGHGGHGVSSGRRLGYVYFELEQRRSLLSQPLNLPPGASLLCQGHAYIGMRFSPASQGATKLLNFDEATMVAHELGHAVHMLCFAGTTQDFDDQPLDLLELPSTLAETVALHPSVIAQYARHHASGGPPSEALTKSCQQGASSNFMRFLQSSSVALGLHSEAFDPHCATPDDLKRESVAYWQRYSQVTADPLYTPLGEDAGVYLAVGSTHVAYLLCHLRADAILNRRGPTSADGRTGNAARRWLNPNFASKVRKQLLDKPLLGNRLATLHAEGSKGGKLPEHPLPQPSSLEVSGLVVRKFGLAS